MNTWEYRRPIYELTIMPTVFQAANSFASDVEELSEDGAEQVTDRIICSMLSEVMSENLSNVEQNNGV